MNRETIYSALFSLLGKLPDIQTSSRKLEHWADVTDFPAVFQAQKTEIGVKQGRGLPTKWTFMCDLYIYVKAEPGQPSSPLLNNVMDNIENALKPPDGLKQTLGGLVHDCYIDGQVTTDEGTLGELGVAIIPVHIIVAN